MVLGALDGMCLAAITAVSEEERKKKKKRRRSKEINVEDIVLII
jgi:hypothetical protein